MDDTVDIDTNGLNLRWSFGFNTSAPCTVHSLATSNRNAVLYVSAHTGVIHDIDQDLQHLLQGHCNPITAVCVSRDKRWIATADSGEGSMIVVWDSKTAAPVKILTKPYEAGIAAMDMSSDSMFLATVSAGFPQEISIWEWTVATKDPAATCTIAENEGLQHSVRFNPVDVRDIVSNGKEQVLFWHWTEEALTAFHPPKGIDKLKKAVGDLTQTCFIPYTTKAVTATSTGNAVLWDYPLSELVHSSARDAIKILQVVPNTGINVLDTVLDRYVVCGCEDGGVRFFDFQFRVVAWFEDIKSGQITSLSFAESAIPKSAPSSAGNASTDEFSVPDCVVGTTEGKIIRLEAKSVEQLSERGRRGELLVKGFDGDVNAMDAHPSLPLFAVGTIVGTLQIWDIDDRVINTVRKFEPKVDPYKKKTKMAKGETDQSCMITCLKYGPMGAILAVGFANGQLRLINSQEEGFEDEAGELAPMQDISTFKHSIGCVTDICFSHDGLYLATADADMCVGLYRYYHRDEDVTKPEEWIFVGKFRSHYKPITSVFFERPSEQRKLKMGDDANDTPILYSLGEDRILHEYAVGASTIREGVQLANSTKVDQTAVPTACVSIPGKYITREKLEEMKADPSEDALSQEYLCYNKATTEDGEEEDDSEGLWTADTIVTANDEFKFKTWDHSSELKNVDYYANYTNCYEEGGGDEDHAYSKREKNIKVSRKTVLAPTYGGTINKIFILPQRKGESIVPSQYLVYGTFEKVVGLVKLPLDGCPNKSMALIAHPGEISCVCSSFDGKYLLTAGGSDRSVKLWAVNTNAVEANVQLGGQGIDPYMSLIEGGRGGAFYQDMLDYFYYAQLCSQGINTTVRRKITGYIPVHHVIHLMRALGYYPTQQEVMDIENEIHFSHQTHLGSYKDKVDLEEFIKLYVNYRPVFGLGKGQFKGGFQALKAIKGEFEKGEEGVVRLSRDELCEHLQTLGEMLSADELVGALQALSGHAYEVPTTPLELAEMMKSLLAKDYTPQSFAQDILGFEDYSG